MSSRADMLRNTVHYASGDARDAGHCGVSSFSDDDYCDAYILLGGDRILFFTFDTL